MTRDLPLFCSDFSLCAFPLAPDAMKPSSEADSAGMFGQLFDDHVGRSPVPRPPGPGFRDTGRKSDRPENGIAGKSGPLGMAYDRAEFMDQRRQMMDIWADYLERLAG